MTFLPCILQWLPIGLKIKAELFHVIYKSPVFFSPYCISSHVLQLFPNDSAIHIGMCPWGVWGCGMCFLLSSSNSLSSSPPVYILFLAHEMILLSFPSTHPSGLLTSNGISFALPRYKVCLLLFSPPNPILSIITLEWFGNFIFTCIFVYLISL